MTDQLDRIIDLSFALHRVVRRHACDFTGDAKRGVGLVHLQALAFIAERGTITMSELARWLMISPSSATSFVARLHRLGLIKRMRDPKKRTIVRLKLTPKGSVLIGQTFKAHRSELRSLMGKLPKNVQHQFADSLSHVIHHFSSL